MQYEGFFTLRAGRITGSRMADLMAQGRSGPAAARANLLATLAVERLTGTCVETFTNAAMQRGNDLEPAGILAYEIASGNDVEESSLICHPRLPWVGVSPDGLIDDDGLVEIKCPSSMPKHIQALSAPDKAWQEYRWQLQAQLWVTGRQWVDAVSYDPRFPEGLQIGVHRIYPCKADFDAMNSACVAAEDEIQAILVKLEKLRS